MRVLQVVRPSAGGIRTHIHSLLTGLIARGIDARYASNADPRMRFFAERWTYVPIRSRPHPLHDLRAARRVAGLSRDLDLLHGHGLRGAWIAALGARIARKPFVFTAHNLVPSSPGALARFALRFVARRASAAICVSEAIAAGLRPYTPDGTPIEVIPNGVDINAFKVRRDRAEVVRSMALPEELAGEDVRWVVSLGRLSREKGFDLVPQIAELVTPRGVPVYFIIAGSGDQLEPLRAQAEGSPARDRVLVPGGAPSVAALLRAADLVVIPSREEGQGIVALEAMAAGVPVVVSGVGGLPETVDDAGVVVPRGDVRAFAEAVEWLLCDRDRWEDFTRRAMERVRDRYGIDAMLDRTIEVYRKSAGA